MFLDFSRRQYSKRELGEQAKRSQHALMASVERLFMTCCASGALTCSICLTEPEGLSGFGHAENQSDGLHADLICMKVTARTHAISIVLYSLPFLAIVAFSLLFVWAGNLEMIVAGVALLPAVMYFFGVRWCRYVVGVFAAITLLLCSMVPIIRGSDGKYFWLIGSPIGLIFAFSTLISFIPARQKRDAP